MPIQRLTPELVADICRNYRDLAALNLSHNSACVASPVRRVKRSVQRTRGKM